MNIPSFALPIVISLAFLSAVQAQTGMMPVPATTAPAVISGGIVIVKDEADTAKARVTSEAVELLKRSDYQGLDTMAARLRRDPVAFSRGDWSIAFFFSALGDLPKQATEAEWQDRVA